MSSATIEEKYNGRTQTTTGGVTTNVAIRYIVNGAADMADAIDAVEAGAPASVDGVTLQSVTGNKEVGGGFFEITANYGQPGGGNNQGGDDGGDTFEFDTTGGTQHITQSIATVNRYGDKAVPGINRAIGWDGERVQGTDIVVPVFNFTRTKRLDSSVVDNAYRANVKALTGKVNNAAFDAFDAGEVLFLGARGRRRLNTSKWDLVFSFAVQDNQTGIMVGDIGPITKGGWEYMWVQYEPEANFTFSVILPKPSAVYVEQVYEDADFSTLGL